MEGTYHGGYLALGYDAVHTGRINKKGHPVRDYAINEDEAKIVDVIFRKTVDEGYGSYRLANWLNDHAIPTKGKVPMWQASTIRSVLLNPMYVGRLRCGDDLTDEIPGLRLIDDYYFAKANELIKARASAYHELRKGPARSTVHGLLTGIIYCAECGGRLTYAHDFSTKTLVDGTKKTYEQDGYRCFRKRYSKATCSAKCSYKKGAVEEKVLRVVRCFFDNVRHTPAEDMLAMAIRQKDGIEKTALKNAEAAFRKAKRDLEALENEAIKAITGDSQLDLSVVNMLIQKHQATLEAAKVTYEGLVAAAETQAEQQAYKEAEVAMIKSWADSFDAMELDAKRTVLSAMIDRVEVSSDYKVLIRFNLTMHQFLGEVVAA